MRSLYYFDVYYYSDLIKFLKLLEGKGDLVSVVNYYGCGRGCSHGYSIGYIASKPIEMEILC